MLPYALLIIIPALFCIPCFKSKKRDIYLIAGKNKNRKIKLKELALPTFFVILALLLVLRKETIGRDLLNYKNLFLMYSDCSIGSILKFKPEALFRVLNLLIGRFTNDYQWYLAICALLTIVPIGITYCRDREHPYVKMILFVNMSTFAMLFSGIRQSLAIAVGMIAYHYVKEKRPLPFLLCVLLGLGFHHSAFMLLLLYPLYYFKIQKKYLWFIVPTISLVFIFNKQIFFILSKLFPDYPAEITLTSAYGSLVLFVLFSAFMYIIVDEKQMDEEANGLRNYMVFAVILQCFAPLNFLAMRMNYYFIVFIPMAMGKFLEIPRAKYRQISKLGEIVIFIFFTLNFFISGYVSAKTGISALDTYPYLPFWK